MISKITTLKITDVLIDEIGLAKAKALSDRLILISGNVSFRLSMEEVREEIKRRIAAIGEVAVSGDK